MGPIAPACPVIFVFSVFQLLRKPIPIDVRRNLRWFDLAAPAPENIRVRNGDAAQPKMLIDGRLVIQEQLFISAVRHSHDVYVLEFRPGLAPVAMRQNMMAADLAACFDFTTRRYCPVKQGVESRNTDAGGGWFDML